MASTPSHDLVVLGAGAAGLTAAGTAAKLGAKVALVERETVGGDCTWYGCVPSKSLLRAARAANETRSAARLGVRTGYPEVSMAGERSVRAHIRSAIERIRVQETPERLAERGVEVVKGEARFVAPGRIEVKGARESPSGRRIVIATGAAPLLPEVEGLADIPFRTYRDVFDLEHLPERLIVLGGGPTGCELAQAFARLGAGVTVVDERVLGGEAPHVGEVIRSALSADGVRFVTGLAEAARVEGSARSSEVIVRTSRAEDGTAQELRCDLVLVATGRRPALASLALESGGIDHDRNGIRVDRRLRTSNRRTYAAGDCVAGNPQFTHVAGWQGSVAARNALIPLYRRAGAGASTPRVVFTDPEVATVGLSASEARERYDAAARVLRRPLARVDRAVTDAAARFGFLELVHHASGAVLGATIVAPRASEVIGEVALAIEHGHDLSDLSEVLHPYPSYAVALQELAGEAELDRVMGGPLGTVIRWLTGRV